MVSDDGRVNIAKIYRRAIADFGITAPKLYDEMDYEALGTEFWNTRFKDVTEFLEGTGDGNVAIYKSVLNLCAQRSEDLAITDRPKLIRAAYAGYNPQPSAAGLYVIGWLSTLAIFALIIGVWRS